MDDMFVTKALFLIILNTILLLVGIIFGQDEKGVWRTIAILSTAWVNFIVIFKF